MLQPEILSPEQTREHFTDARVRSFAEAIITHYEQQEERDHAASQSRIERQAGQSQSAVSRLFKSKGQREKEVRKMHTLLADSRDTPQLFSARIGEDIVATTGYRMIGNDPDTHSPVWEIVQVFVSEQHRGNKLSWKLMDEAENAIRKADAAAAIVIVSDSPSVQKWADGSKYKRITLEDHWKIEHPSEKISDQKKAEFQGKADKLLAYRKTEFA